MVSVPMGAFYSARYLACRSFFHLIGVMILQTFANSPILLLHLIRFVHASVQQALKIWCAEESESERRSSGREIGIYV